MGQLHPLARELAQNMTTEMVRRLTFHTVWRILKACSGAHFLRRTLREQGHSVKLIVTQFVKPFVKRLPGCRSDCGDGRSLHALRSDQNGWLA